LTPNVYN
jgi:serine/threonine protein kinase